MSHESLIQLRFIYTWNNASLFQKAGTLSIHRDMRRLHPSGCKAEALLCVLHNTENTASADWRGEKDLGTSLSTDIRISIAHFIVSFQWDLLLSFPTTIYSWYVWREIYSQKKKDYPRPSWKWPSWYDRIFCLGSASDWGRRCFEVEIWTIIEKNSRRVRHIYGSEQKPVCPSCKTTNSAIISPLPVIRPTPPMVRVTRPANTLTQLLSSNRER